MSYTISTAYKYASQNTALGEEWLIQLYYDTGTSFLGISGSDVIVSSIQYYGIVQDYGNISQSVDISCSSSSTGTIEIQCINKLKNTSLAEELVYGTRKYVNRKVNIYSSISGMSNISDCVLHFQGRLADVSVSGNSVVLSIEQYKPEYKHTVPYDVTIGSRTWVPAIYGTYTPETSTVASPDFCTSAIVHPLPVADYRNRKINCLNHQSDGLSSGRLHYYDADAGIFVPLDGAPDTTNTYNTSWYAYKTDWDLHRSFKLYPLYVNENNQFSNAVAAIDGDTGTYTAYSPATLTVNGVGTHAASSTQNLIFDMPNIEGGKITRFDMYVRYRTTLSASKNDVTSPYSEISIKDISYPSAPVTVVSDSSSASTYSNTIDTSNTISLLTNYQNNNSLPETISLRCEVKQSGTGNSAGSYSNTTGTFRIYLVYIILTVQLDFANEYIASKKVVADLDKLYSASYGFGNSYSGGTGYADTPNKIHRDLLARYTGFDYADAYMSNWSGINTARSAWICRWWQLEPRSLPEILERLQYEGCFSFVLRPDGGRYIYVKDSYSSGDVVHTFNDNDMANGLSISITPVSDLVTEATYHYRRHPADEKYLDNYKYSNSSARTTWNIATKENTIEENLEFLYTLPSGSTPNSNIYMYYDNINGNPKIVVRCDLINKSKFNIELGDCVKFSNTSINPFGKSWGNLYFMVTEINRTINKISFTAREVYTT